jgi:hypothetical protein
MQPYLFPYQGYFNLMASCDIFVLRDTVEYSKRGWINRNQLEVGNMKRYFTIPIVKGSDFQKISEKKIVSTWLPSKLANSFIPWLAGAANRDVVTQMKCLQDGILTKIDSSLFEYIFETIIEMKDLLDLKCEVVRESEVVMGQVSKGEMGVMELCQSLGGKTYINLPGGRNLYNNANFAKSGLNLYFLNPSLRPYFRGQKSWTASLSIVDMISYVGIEESRNRIHNDFYLSKD